MSEQFENSIRKKLQEADVPFDPAAWDQMKKRLDDSGRRRGAFYWWIAGLLLFLGMGSWWWFAQYQPETKSEKNRIAVTDSSATGSNTPSSPEKENIPGQPAVPNTALTPAKPLPNTPGGSVPVTTSGVDVDKPANNAGTASAPRIGKTPSGKYTTNVDNAQPQRTTAGKTGGKPAGYNTVPANSPAPANIIPAPLNTLKDSSTNTVSVDKPRANNAPPAAIIPTPLIIAKDSSKSTVGVDKPKAINAPPPTNAPATTANDTAQRITNVDNPSAEKKKKQKRGFDAGITLGPDYNAVMSLKAGRLGFGGGLLIRYHINNNFYLSTGASYNKKLYGAEDKDYNSPYPTYYKKIDADCNVLDIPLNVHYSFLHKPKSTWSAMVGASSYFMVKEKYEYYTYSGGKYRREYNNDNQHYFSVLNLGVNYERNTGGIIKWGVQPYVKLPLAGVGQGSVKLLSAGVSFQVTVGKKD